MKQKSLFPIISKKKNNNKIINESTELLIIANKKQIIKKIHGTKKDDKENSSSKNKNTLEFSSNIMSSSKNDWKLGPSGSKKKVKNCYLSIICDKMRVIFVF